MFVIIKSNSKSCMLAVIYKASINCTVRAILLLCLLEHKCSVTLKSMFCVSHISTACTTSSGEFDSGGCQFQCLTRQTDIAVSYWMAYSTCLGACMLLLVGCRQTKLHCLPFFLWRANEADIFMHSMLYMQCAFVWCSIQFYSKAALKSLGMKCHSRKG